MLSDLPHKHVGGAVERERASSFQTRIFQSAPGATVTLKHLAAAISEFHEISKKQTEAVLTDLVGLVTRHLKNGDRIRIGDLGVLVVRKRAARMARNPATGEPMEIKSSRKVAFQAAKQLKEAV